MRLVLLGSDKARLAQRARQDIQGGGYLFLQTLEKWVVTAAPGWQCFPVGTAGVPSAVVMCWLQQQRALQTCQAVGTRPASLGTAETGMPSWTAACLVCSLDLALLLCSIILERHASREECLLAISVSQLFSLLACVL